MLFLIYYVICNANLFILFLLLLSGKNLFLLIIYKKKQFKRITTYFSELGAGGAVLDIFIFRITPKFKINISLVLTWE
jgi:hypothetical protein